MEITQRSLLRDVIAPNDATARQQLQRETPFYEANQRNRTPGRESKLPAVSMVNLTLDRQDETETD